MIYYNICALTERKKTSLLMLHIHFPTLKVKKFVSNLSSFLIGTKTERGYSKLPI